MKRTTKTTLALLMLGSIATSTQAANMIINGDFEDPDITTDANTTAIPNWNKEAGLNRMDQTLAGSFTSLLPGNPTVGTSQALRMGGTALARISQDIIYNWAATDTFSIGFNSAEAYWRAATNGDDLTVRIVETLSGDILWASALIDMDGTHAGDVAAADLQDWSAAQTFGYTVDASTFTTGTAGSAISIEFESHGIVSLDNVSVDVVPEPSSTSLLGLGALALILRRRK